MNFRKCFWYLILISALSFFVGRALPKKWFHANLFPYRTFSFEKGGKIYEKLYIHKWQNRVPDMSRILPNTMPAKRLTADCYHKLPRMIQETCVAEFIHCMNSVAGFYCAWLYPDGTGMFIAFIYAALFNFPYVLIQRYNRPRLIALQARMKQREERIAKLKAKGDSSQNGNIDPQRQCGRGTQFLCEGDSGIL